LKNISIPDGQTNMPTKTNIWKQVIDPIGWSSKWIAPSWWYNKWKPEWYWILWKIPELRPMSGTFNRKIYNEIMNIKISLEHAGISIEKWPQEIAIMPTYKIKWWEEVISQFSEDKKEWDIQTAKHYWVNND
jgi:hypothetical protein